MTIHWLDLLALGIYFILISLIGYFAGRNKKQGSSDYFLAGKSLPWYVVGSSYIAANISSEQFLGTIGAAVLYGICVAAPEWAAVIAFSFLIWIFIPFLLVSKIDTIPGFLEKRFGKAMRNLFAIISVLGNIAIFMAPVLYGGGLAIEKVFGINSFLGIDTNMIVSGESINWGLMVAIMLISIISGAWAIWGGLKSVAWMDLLTILIMVGGGLTVTIVGLLHLGEGEGLIAGFGRMLEVNKAQAGPALDWVKANASNLLTGAETGDTYKRLSVIQPFNHKTVPWTHWAFSFFYIGLWYTVVNQHMIQKVLAAKNMYHARMGMVFASFLKILLPFVVVFPGLVYFAMQPDWLNSSNWLLLSEEANNTYTIMIASLMPVFVGGILLAALLGAIQSTVCSVLNSTSTIFTIDIYKQYINKNATAKSEIKTGRISGALFLIASIAVAVIMSFSKFNIFVYTQTLYTFIGAPFSAVFLLAVVWRRFSGKDALISITLSFALYVIIKIMVAGPLKDSGTVLEEFLTPYANQGLIVWVFAMLTAIVSALLTPRPDARQVTDQLTINWKKMNLGGGLGTKWYNNVIFWWGLCFMVMVVLVLIFSLMV